MNKEEKIIVDFDKMDKIGNEIVSKINKRILKFFKERNKLVEIRNKEIIDYVLGCGNITLENKEEIKKRNKGIIDYIVKCDYICNEEEMVKRYKEIIEIRNNGKKDWCIKTDKQMIKKYREIIEIRYNGNDKIINLIQNNVLNQFQFSYNQMKEWIKCFIEINGIERLLEIYEDERYFYDYLLYWEKGKTHKNSDYWFFRETVKGILGI